LEELLIATTNTGKIAEFQALLPSFRCIGQNQLGIEGAAETGLTFIENALQKARHTSKAARRAVLADDSGLVVEALKGQPGIYSSRYAGVHAADEDNIHLLLKNLRKVGGENRAAFFYCVLVFIRDAEDPVPDIAFGRWSGFIAEEIMGRRGFGYDPVFYLPEFKATAAELPSPVKNVCSHRAKAVSSLMISSQFFSQRNQLGTDSC
jgi:XTP/dITP diphosphohydrolase